MLNLLLVLLSVCLQNTLWAARARSVLLEAPGHKATAPALAEPQPAACAGGEARFRLPFHEIISLSHLFAAKVLKCHPAPRAISPCAG